MARQTKGRIYKAESGTYFVEYRHQGKRVRRSLGTSRLREANAKAATLLAPFRASTEVDRRAAAVASLRTAEDDLQAAVVATNPALVRDLAPSPFGRKGRTSFRLKDDKPDPQCQSE